MHILWFGLVPTKFVNIGTQPNYFVNKFNQIQCLKSLNIIRLSIMSINIQFHCRYKYFSVLQIIFFFYSNLKLNKIETIFLFFWVNVSMRPLAKQNILFPLTLPTLIFGSYTEVAISIFRLAPSSQILNSCCITCKTKKY